MGIEGSTPPQSVVSLGRSVAARTVLDAGADTSLRCADHWSALDWAACKGHEDVAMCMQLPLVVEPLFTLLLVVVKPGVASLLLARGA